MSGGELFTHLYQRDRFAEDEVRVYIGEVILALEHLHKVHYSLSLLCSVHTGGSVWQLDRARHDKCSRTYNDYYFYLGSYVFYKNMNVWSLFSPLYHTINSYTGVGTDTQAVPSALVYKYCSVIVVKQFYKNKECSGARFIMKLLVLVIVTCNLML